MIPRWASRRLTCAVFIGLLGLGAAPAPPAQWQDGYRFPVPEIDWAPRGTVCFRADPAPIIDGLLDDPAWKNAPWTEDFTDIQGPLRPAPRFRTRARLLWDDQYLYIGAEMDEPDLWATLTTRDAVIFHDNDFEVFIDPDGDTHQYYELEMNALNTVWDLLLIQPYRDGGPAVNAWDIAGLKTAVHLDGTVNDPSDRDRGWTVEIAIPWDVLGQCAHRPAPPAPGDQWRVNFSRVEWTRDVAGGRYVRRRDPATGRDLPEDNWVWSPQGLINMHYPEMWGFVQFSARTGGAEAFQRDPEGAVAWKLRLVYYAERDRQEKSEGLTADGRDLRPPVDPTQVRIWTLPDGFEATAPSLDGKSLWHIREDGRIWKSAP